MRNYSESLGLDISKSHFDAVLHQKKLHRPKVPEQDDMSSANIIAVEGLMISSYISYYTADENFLLDYLDNVFIFICYTAIGSRIYVMRSHNSEKIFQLDGGCTQWSGVAIRSQHAGMVIVADGTPEAGSAV